MVEHLKDPAAAADDDELGQGDTGQEEMGQEITGQETTGQEIAKKKKRNKKKNKKNKKKGKTQPKKEVGDGDEEKKGLMSGKVFIAMFGVLFLLLGVLLQIVLF